MMKVKKAVFPVAGLGSRFLPATKANPKEMLPIIDKPLIQYAVEEAIHAGITHMIFITNSSKRAIEDHFDTHPELEAHLLEQGKHALLDLVKNISPPHIHFSYVRQNRPQGLGHAILCAEHIIGDEPFAVLLADDLIDNTKLHCLSTMIDLYQTEGHSVIAVQPVPWEHVQQYGVVRVTDSSKSTSSIIEMIEKPQKEIAPSNLAAIGRYVFSPDIFSSLQQTLPDHCGEIQLTNAIQKMLIEHTVQAYQFYGKRYDCGSKLGYLQATVEFGMRHPEMGSVFTDYLRSIAMPECTTSSRAQRGISVCLWRSLAALGMT
ncbi:MAG: UTP--glucose-1-phosphate uridylyltransferase GalU [Gammaproteobacteria bacterium]|nr:UTP--glucose-1-phosphate uridylyltransferase GalU [Gammaproteobacteria bacterium]